jgi:hypothetical protein
MVPISGAFSGASLSRKFVAELVCHSSQFSHRLWNAGRRGRNSSCYAGPDECFMISISGCLSGASLSREHVTLGIAWQVLGVCRRANADCECGRECKQNCSHSPFSLLKAAMLSK